MKPLNLILPVVAFLLAAPLQSATAQCPIPKVSRKDRIVDVPIRIVDGRIYVEAQVNGTGPYVFAVDTGASGMGRADSSLVSSLGLAITGQAAASDGISQAAVQTVGLDAIALGGLKRDALTLITRDYSSRAAPEAKMAGILGREFFADGLLVIDYPARRLIFTRTATLTPNRPGILHYERAFRIPASIGTLKTTANLDTGANVTFVLPKSLYLSIAGGPLEAAGKGSLTNNEINTSRAVVHGPFRVGGAESRDVDVRVSEQYPELLVGAHFLQHHRIAIDQRRNAIALCPGK